MNESDLRKEFKDGTRNLGHVTHVESHALSDGFPDEDYCFNGIDGHMELKYAEEEKLKKDFIRPSQVRWAGKRLRAGGNLWLLLKFKNEGVIGYALYRGDKLKQAAKFKKLSELVMFADFIWHEEMKWEELTALISIGRFFREIEAKKEAEGKKSGIILPGQIQ